MATAPSTPDDRRRLHLAVSSVALAILWFAAGLALKHTGEFVRAVPVLAAATVAAWLPTAPRRQYLVAQALLWTGVLPASALLLRSGPGIAVSVALGLLAVWFVAVGPRVLPRPLPQTS
jgi:hypothetical protein